MFSSTFPSHGFSRGRFTLAVFALSLVAGSRLAAQGLLSYYSFDAGQTQVSGGLVLHAFGPPPSTTLVPTGQAPTADPNGRFGQAIDFSGPGGVGSMDNSAFVNGSVSLGFNFSISLWLKTSDVTANSQSYLFQIGASSGEPQNAILFGYTPGVAELYTSSLGFDGTNPRSTSGITLSSSLNNTWFNLVYTYDGTTFTGYLNGAQVFATTIGFNLGATGGLSIGGARNGAATFPGSMDDVAIWNGALSASQVAALQSVPADQLSAIPEPSTYAVVFGTAVLGAAAWRRKRRVIASAG